MPEPQVTEQAISVYILLFALGAATMFALYAFAVRRRTAPGARSYMVLAILIGLFCALCVPSFLDLEDATLLILIRMRFTVLMFIPVGWLAFALEYTGRSALLTPRRIAMLAVVPFLSASLLWCDHFLHFVMVPVYFTLVGSYKLTHLTFSLLDPPWFKMIMAYSYLLVLAGVILLGHAAVKLFPLHRMQAGALAAGVLLPVAASAYTAFLSIPGVNAVDALIPFTAFGFVLGGLVWSWAIFRHRLFDLKPVARNLLVDNMEDGMLALDDRGRVIDMNPAMGRIVDTAPEEAVGRDAAELLARWPELAARCRNGGGERIEIRLMRSGVETWYDVRHTPLAASERGMQGRLIMLRDITQLKEVQAALEELATTDALTWLINRRQFRYLAKKQLDLSIRFGRPLALIFLDIDQFKKVNDLHGHAAGDRALVHVAGCVLECLRDVDLCGRYGGEEFSILLPETGMEDALKIAERVRKRIAAQIIETPEAAIKLTVSIGAAALDAAGGRGGGNGAGVMRGACDGDGAAGAGRAGKAGGDVSDAGRVDLDGLLKRADDALYEAKESGRNRVCRWE